MAVNIMRRFSRSAKVDRFFVPKGCIEVLLRSCETKVCDTAGFKATVEVPESDEVVEANVPCRTEVLFNELFRGTDFPTTVLVAVPEVAVVPAIALMRSIADVEVLFPLLESIRPEAFPILPVSLEFVFVPVFVFAFDEVPVEVT